MMGKKVVWPRYYGTPEFICRAVINALWNDKDSHFFTSIGTHGVLDMRDFAFNVEALLAEGYTKEVILTIAYLCEKFSKAKKITTDIDHNNRVYNAGDPVDSLPLLLYAISLTKKHCKGINKQVLQKLLDKHTPFLENQAYLHAQNYFDFPSGRVRLDKAFRSLMRQQRRTSTLYDNCMIAIFSRSLDEMHMKNPYYGIDFSQTIAHFFWSGGYFKEDQTNSLRVTFEANILPFTFGIITNDELWVAAFASINRIGLDYPFPAKFSQTMNLQRLHPAYAFDIAYQTTSIWPQLAMLFIQTLDARKDEGARKYIEAYANILRQHNNALEVLSADGSEPYNGVLVRSRHTHLWAANFMHFAKKYDVV